MVLRMYTSAPLQFVRVFDGMFTTSQEGSFLYTLQRDWQRDGYIPTK